MQQVAVLIPIYKTTLNAQDLISLKQTYQVLGNYTLIVIHPEGLDLSQVSKDFPRLQFKSFAPYYFKDIVGYNKLMLAQEFYEAFVDYEYILIDQLDVFIFKDELTEWCNKGYDYIGAPWIRRKVYKLPIVKQLISLYVWWKHLKGERSQFDRYDKIGNGGLSLRKVKSHIDVIKNQPEDVKLYAEINNRKHLFNEDTFWAMEPKNFKYPTVEEAMLFSYNKYPELSYKLTGGKTPFGCHGWTKPKYKEFWCKNGNIPAMPNE